MEILIKQNYSVNNLLTFRGKVSQESINNIMQQMNKYVKESNVEVTGSVITAIHSINAEGNNQIYDFEIMLPLSKKVNSFSEFIFKDNFILSDSLMFRHIGNPQSMNSEMEELVKYINDNQLKPVTPFYNVTVKGAATPAEIDSMIVDIYVGVESNNS